MSYSYNVYLENHKKNVAKAFYWIRDNLPELLEPGVDYEHQICYAHDDSKTKSDEYDAYDAYFYGGNRSYGVTQAFKKAWLLHQNRNPHHWQYWVLINDDPEDKIMVYLDMPDVYIVEMICDWWSFSWASENLAGMFSWYEDHKSWMMLGDGTRQRVEEILSLIKSKIIPEESKDEA